MTVLRWISLILIVVALMLLGADIVSTLEREDGAVLRSLDGVLALVGASPRDWIEANLPNLAAWSVVTLMSAPGWMSLGVLGLFLAWLSSRRREPTNPAVRLSDLPQASTIRRPPLAH